MKRAIILAAALAVVLFVPAGFAADDPLAGRVADLKARYAEIERGLKSESAVADRLAKLGYGGRAKRNDLEQVLSRVAALQKNLVALGRELDTLTDLAMQARPVTVASLDSRCGPIPTEPEKRLAPARLHHMRAVLDRILDAGNAILPQGMSRDQAYRYGVGKEATGVCFYTALRELFEEGARQVSAQYRIDRDKEKAETQAGTVTDAADAAQQAKQDAADAKKAADAARTGRRPTRASTTSAFRQNLKTEKDKAERTAGGVGTGSGMDAAFEAGAKEEQAFKNLDAKYKELAAAQAHLAEVEARIKAREEQAAKEDAEFWAGFNAFMGAMGQAAAQIQAPRAPKVPRSDGGTYTVEDDANASGTSERKIREVSLRSCAESWQRCVEKCSSCRETSCFQAYRVCIYGACQGDDIASVSPGWYDGAPTQWQRSGVIGTVRCYAN